MKYLLVLIVVLAVLWLARSSRRAMPPRPDPRSAPPSDNKQQAIVACAHCGLHLPRDEALPGRGGVFCSEAHRSEYEKAHPPT